jgi:5-formyltetrahydrofolate cyclo-ligase
MTLKKPPANQRKELRDEMRRVLAGLDSRWLQAASAEIARQLNHMFEQEFGESVRHILAWVPYFPGEIDLSGFISAQLGVREVYLPRVAPDYGMTFISVAGGWESRLSSGHFGIPEPAMEAGRAFDPQLAPQTAVIVPGLAFDTRGNRLGRGAGCYDRFFSDPEMLSARRVGVCWSLQVVKLVPTSAHDIPMQWLCHEREIYRINGRAER